LYRLKQRHVYHAFVSEQVECLEVYLPEISASCAKIASLHKTMHVHSGQSCALTFIYALIFLYPVSLLSASVAQKFPGNGFLALVIIFKRQGVSARPNGLISVPSLSSAYFPRIGKSSIEQSDHLLRSRLRQSTPCFLTIASMM
jgi:hypothetical protein